MPKITVEKKAAILADYQTREYSYGKLALKYLVSRRSVEFITHPEKLQRLKEIQEPKSREKNIADCKKYREKKRAERLKKQAHKK